VSPFVGHRSSRISTVRDTLRPTSLHRLALHRHPGATSSGPVDVHRPDFAAWCRVAGLDVPYSLTV